MDLNSSVRYVPQVGPMMAGKLEKLGIKTVSDLLYHLPFRYDDFSHVSKISSVRAGEIVSIRGKVVGLKNEFTKQGKRLQKGIVRDDYGEVGVIWFNQVYLPKILIPGTEISVSGKVDFFGPKKSFISPEYEILRGDQETIHTGRLVPVYPETAGVSSKWLRTRVKSLLGSNLEIIETLPTEFLNKHNLIALRQAIEEVHFPVSLEMAEMARRRLAFEELLSIQLAALERKRSWSDLRTAQVIKRNEEKIKLFISRLPFNLTGSQMRATEEILSDIEKGRPMNRLLEGDTGSGKTVVAAIAAYSTCLNGYKTVFMAPTEILANQHKTTLDVLLEPFGIKIGLITGSSKPKLENFDVLVGTQALLFQKPINKVALLIIDEQHRFGVSQRTKLTSGRVVPHLLTMTATPIPRTIALTFYGDLDLSLLDELPEGRKRVKTYVVPPEKRLASFKWLSEQIVKLDTQAFVVYPLIEESETLSDVRAATKEYEILKENFLGRIRLGLLHGRMKSNEKKAVIESFANGEIKVLVSTPVVEVGIDVPRATIMIIEGAERFGLAQLHQLRGRVGRSDQESSCFLLTESDNETALKRLSSLTRVYSGAALAEIDLGLRGPGEIYGLKQHGFPDLKAASITDHALISETRAASFELIDNLDKLPALRKSLESYTIADVLPN